MSAQVTSMLAYKVRKLGGQCADDRQIAEAVRRLLECERNMLVSSNAQASNLPVCLRHDTVRALPGT